jgi:hypothetical protein
MIGTARLPYRSRPTFCATLVRALRDWQGVVHVHGEQCGVFSGRQTGEGSSEEPRLKVAELSPGAADRFAG